MPIVKYKIHRACKSSLHRSLIGLLLCWDLLSEMQNFLLTSRPIRMEIEMQTNCFLHLLIAILLIWKMYKLISDCKDVPGERLDRLGHFLLSSKIFLYQKSSICCDFLAAQLTLRWACRHTLSFSKYTIFEGKESNLVTVVDGSFDSFAVENWKNKK